MNQQGDWRTVNLEDSRATSYGRVVCRQLGCGSAVSVKRNLDSVHQPVWDVRVNCWGTESAVGQCQSRESHGRQTSVSELEVNCSASVRLEGNDGRCRGQVEVKSGHAWGPLCQTDFSWQAGSVICRELGCGFFSSYHSWLYADMEVPIVNGVFRCEGDENHLLDCPASGSLEDTCTPAILQCIDTPHAPSVYLYSTISGMSEDQHPKMFQGLRFAISCFASSHPYRLHSFRLSGPRDAQWTQPARNESAHFLFPAANATHAGIYRCSYSYYHTQDVFSATSSLNLSLKELNDVRLVEDGSRCAGGLEVEHRGEWRPVTYRDSWSLKEAAVVCRQLDCGSAVATRRKDGSGEHLPQWRFLSDCDGSESVLMDCGAVKAWPSSSAGIEVVCSDLLFQPNITPYSFMNGVSETKQQELEVFRDHSFSITCSIQPQYPGGEFHLVFTGSNSTDTLTQPAVNHSATFLFSAAGDAHLGNYTCVYRTNAFSHSFSSESKPLSFTVFLEFYEVLLLEGSNRCSGTLFLYYLDEMMPVGCESSVWSLKHAAIVCRQLRCGTAVSTRERDVFTKEPVWRFFSDCDGSEAALMDCGTTRTWLSSFHIEVVCSDHQGAETVKSED
ncbi:scavenger receptor cysteine-rich type 1 protein M130-like [Polymixia lowei]